MNKILLVEDDQIQIEIIRRRLEAEGFHLVVARTGREAIRLARQELPDLILMDMILPGMHGLEASIALKETPETAKIPIVALTIMSAPRFVEECYKVGIAGFIRKPAAPQRILDSIVKIIGKPKRAPLILAAAGGSDMLTGITSTLRMLDYKVLVAGDVAKAVSYAKTMKPDIIVMDMTMPSEETLTILEKLRKNEETRKIPLILAGEAENKSELISRAAAVGAAETFTHPFDPDIIVRKIRKVLKED